MDSGEVVAREGIRDLIARYAHYADGGRFAELAKLFSDEGVLEIADGPTLTGPEAIEAFLSQVKESLVSGTGRPWVRHHVSSVLIDVAGADEALASSYFFVVTATGVDHWGRYRDELRRIGSGWRFRRRRVRVEGRAAGSWAERR